MNILMLCTKYPLELGNEYLTNELADALAAAGHEVQVVATDWGARQSTPSAELKTASGVKVLFMTPVTLKGIGQFGQKAIKWLASPLTATMRMRRRLKGRRFDAIIGFSPSILIAPQLLWARAAFRARTYLVQWDFFPFHHRSLGLIPGGPVFWFARLLEERTIRGFDVIGCMSPMNITYLKENYHLQSHQKVEHLPIWGKIEPPTKHSTAALRTEFGLPVDKQIVVFGGQITQGRGIEEILAAADLARAAFPDVVFLMIGQGRLVGLVRDHIAAGAKNIILRERIERHRYLSLIAACDVGLVVTTRNVNVPTFPSKVIDYLRAGIPVVASVEESTDYGAFIVKNNIGLAIQAGDPSRLLVAIDKMLKQPENRAEIVRAGRRCLEEVFDVRHAARSIVESLN